MLLVFCKKKAINKGLVFLLSLLVVFGGSGVLSAGAVTKKMVPFASFPIPLVILASKTKSLELAFKTSGMLTITLKAQISSGRGLSFILTSGGATFKEAFSAYSPLEAKIGWEIKDVSAYSTLTIISDAFTAPVSLEINYEPYFVQFLMLRPKVWVNGYPEELDVAPYFVKKNEMLPLRYVTQSLGAKVTWKDKTNSATITFYNKSMKFEVGSKVVNINGIDKTIPVAPEIKNGRTYLPMYVLLNILNLDGVNKKDVGIIFLGGKL